MKKSNWFTSGSNSELERRIERVEEMIKEIKTISTLLEDQSQTVLGQSTIDKIVAQALKG
jgi:hypothetical protein